MVNNIPSSEQVSAFGDFKHYFGELNENEKRAYNAILRDIESFPEEIEIPELNNEELEKVWLAVMYDNPELTSNSTRSTAVNRVVVEMERPLAKFKFISHDIVKFLSYVLQQRAIRQKEAEMKAQQGVSPESADPKADPKADIKNINTNDFRVVFRYQGFMPCSFNMFTNKPADSWTGVAFDSTMQRLSDTEVELGFDYVFVNGGESTVPVSVEVYDTDGTLLSSTLPIDVPVVRNKLTVVRGNFLSSKASGGVSIRTELDGEYNLEIR